MNSPVYGRFINGVINKLDFVAMAKKTLLGQLIVPGYYLPLRQAKDVYFIWLVHVASLQRYDVVRNREG